jgi:Ion channel
MAAMSTPDPEQDRLVPPPVTDRRRPLAERLRAPDSYGLLLLLILLLLLLSAFGSEWPLGRAVTTAGSGATALFAFWTSRPAARVLRWATVAIVLAVIGAVLVPALGSGTVLDGASRLTVALLTAASPVVVARRLLRHPRVQRSTILGALCIYLLFGLSFAYLFSALGAISGPFFSDQPEAAIVDYLYFSYASLTTVGYGDLTPAGDLGRMLAVSEALIGQLYLVTVVALLVGNIGRDRARR